MQLDHRFPALVRFAQRLCALLIIVGLVLTPSFSAPVAAQEAGATVRVEPIELEIGFGQEEEVSIALADAVDVYGIDIRAQFDPAVVEVVDADPTRDGIQMIPGDFIKPDFAVRNLADNEAGTLLYVITQVNPTPPANGTGVVFRVKFRGKVQGQKTELTINFVEMADRTGTKLPVSPQPGTLSVVPPKPETPTPVYTATPIPPTITPTAVQVSIGTPTPYLLKTVVPGMAGATAEPGLTDSANPDNVLIIIIIVGFLGATGVIIAALLLLRRKRPGSSQGGEMRRIYYPGLVWLFRVIVIAVLIALASLIISRAFFIVSAQSGAVLRPDPPVLRLKPGEQATVSLGFENVQDLYGIEVHLSFDPAILEVVDADPARSGVQIQAADWLKDAFVASNLVSNESGKIDFAATLLNPAPPVSGNKAIMTITFKAKQSGSTELTFVSAILATRDATVIETEVQNGQITVSESGQAPIVSVATSSAGSAKKSSSSLIIVAGLSIAVFLGALGILVTALRRRRVG